MIGYWLALLMLLSIPMIAMLFISIMQHKLNDEHPITKIGLILLTAGLIVQLSRSLHFFHYGRYPTDVGVPLWLAKDLGACLLIFYFTYWKDKLQEGTNELPPIDITKVEPKEQPKEAVVEKPLVKTTRKAVDKPNVVAKAATSKRALAKTTRATAKKGKVK